MPVRKPASTKKNIHICHLFSVDVAGFGETGDQQEAWRRLFLYSCHNCCFARHLPGLSDEVIILSGCPLAISKATEFTFMQIMFGNLERPPNQLS
jgi:hypothetical protein